MTYQVITFEELTDAYIGRQVELRTDSKDLAIIEVLDVVRDVDTVNIKYSFISGEEKFKHQGASAVLTRDKKCWNNPSKFWLPYVRISQSRYDLPENNDGRDTCRFCGGKTRRCGGFSMMTDYRVCVKCGR